MIVGAGILGLPYAFYTSGAWLATAYALPSLFSSFQAQASNCGWGAGCWLCRRCWQGSR